MSQVGLGSTLLNASKECFARHDFIYGFYDLVAGVAPILPPDLEELKNACNITCGMIDVVQIAPDSIDIWNGKFFTSIKEKKFADAITTVAVLALDGLTIFAVAGELKLINLANITNQIIRVPVLRPLVGLGLGSAIRVTYIFVLTMSTCQSAKVYFKTKEPEGVPIIPMLGKAKKCQVAEIKREALCSITRSVSKIAQQSFLLANTLVIPATVLSGTVIIPVATVGLAGVAFSGRMLDCMMRTEAFREYFWDTGRSRELDLILIGSNN